MFAFVNGDQYQIATGLYILYTLAALALMPLYRKKKWGKDYTEYTTLNYCKLYLGQATCTQAPTEDMMASL